MARQKKEYYIDGITYFSKTLYDLHVLLSNNKYAKHFIIPTSIKKSKYGAQNCCKSY